MSNLPHPEAFVRWFRQAAPYVHAFRGRTFVIGFGGETVADRGRFVRFLHDLNLLAAIGIRLVLVHGARPQIEAELRAKRQRSRYAKGLRITDANSLMAVKQAAGVLHQDGIARFSGPRGNFRVAGVVSGRGRSSDEHDGTSAWQAVADGPRIEGRPV